MKNIKFFFALLVATLFIVSSCSIERRVHQSGYHVAWKKSQKNNQQSEKEQLLAVDQVAQEETKTIERNSKRKTKEVRYEASNEVLVSKTETKKSAVKNASKADEKSTHRFINAFDSEKTALVNEAVETTKDSNVQENSKSNSSNGLQDDAMFILLILLCLIIPPLAVYLITEDLKTTLISLLLTILFWLPGVIFAFYILFTRY